MVMMQRAMMMERAIMMQMHDGGWGWMMEMHDVYDEKSYDDGDA